MTRREITDRMIDTVAKALRDFGYPIDNDHVRASTERILAGEKPLGGPELFIHGWLCVAGLIP